MRITEKLKKAVKFTAKKKTIAGIAAGVMAAMLVGLGYTPTKAETHQEGQGYKIIDISGIPKCEHILDDIGKLYLLEDMKDTASPEEKKEFQQKLNGILRNLLKGNQEVEITISTLNGSPICDVILIDKNGKTEYREYLDPSKDYEFPNGLSTEHIESPVKLVTANDDDVLTPDEIAGVKNDDPGESEYTPIVDPEHPNYQIVASVDIKDTGELIKVRSKRKPATKIEGSNGVYPFFNARLYIPKDNKDNKEGKTPAKKKKGGLKL